MAKEGGSDVAADRTICSGRWRRAGVFFLALSGDEPLLRKDLFVILSRARELTSTSSSTNAILIKEKEAALIRDLVLKTSRSASIPIALRFMTRSPRCVARLTVNHGDPLFGVAGVEGDDGQCADAGYRGDYLGQRAGRSIQYRPHDHSHMNGDRSLALNISRANLNGDARREHGRQRRGVLRAGASRRRGCDGRYAVQRGVQFPLPSGNVRQQRFINIWQHSPQLKEVA
jgi:hypothetical protein